MHFGEKNINFKKNKTVSKNEDPTHSLIKTKPCSSDHIKITNSKWNCDELELPKKRGHFLYRLFFPKQMFLTFVFYFNVSCIEYTFRICILLHYFIQCSACFLNRRKLSMYP